jgi:uncharacterized protein YaiE (UPF0345 family)
MTGSFVKHDLGSLQGGELVTVTLRGRANVRLLDATNFQRYQRGEQHTLIGGQALHSPFRLRVPHSNHWYLVLDLGGAAGTIHSNVTVTQ